MKTNIFFSALEGNLYGLARVFLSRAVAASGGVLLSYALAKSIGPEALGQFVFAFSIVGVLAIISRLGFDVSLIRSLSKSIALGNQSILKSHLSYSLRVVIQVSSGITLLVFVVINGWGRLINQNFDSWWLIMSLPPITALMVISGYLKARRLTSVASIIEIGGVSFFSGLVILIGSVFVTNNALLYSALMFVGGSFLVAAWALWYSFRDAKRQSGADAQRVVDKDQIQNLKRGRFAYLLIGLSGYLGQAGSFALSGPYLTDVEIGYLRVVERVALIVTFGATVVTPFIAPRVVSHYVKNNKFEIKRVAAFAMSTSFALALLPAVVIFIFAPKILGFFGHDFLAVTDQLRVLVVVNLVVAVLSPISMVLNMMDGERLLMKLSIAFLALASLLFPAVVSLYGVVGFLIVYSLTAVVPNLFILAATIQRVNAK